MISRERPRHKLQLKKLYSTDTSIRIVKSRVCSYRFVVALQANAKCLEITKGINK